MFIIHYLILLTYFISVCLSCSKCYTCESVLENKMNLVDAFKLSENNMKACGYLHDIGTTNCAKLYCSTTFDVDYAYSDLDSQRSISQINVKYMRIKRGCDPPPPLINPGGRCGIFNNTKNQIFKKRCFMNCYDSYCNYMPPEIYYAEYMVNVYPRCLYCQEILYIKSAFDEIKSTSCFTSNQVILFHEFISIACRGSCFTHISYDNFKVIFERGCSTRLHEILRKTYTISKYQECSNKDRSICNLHIVYTNHDLTKDIDLKTINKRIALDIIKRKQIDDSISCRKCVSIGNPLENNSCTDQSSSTIECDGKCYARFNIYREPGNTKMKLFRGCLNGENITTKNNVIDNKIGCHAEMNMDAKPTHITNYVKKDLVIIIDSLLDCISICILLYREHCIGYDYDKETMKCSAYTKIGKSMFQIYSFTKITEYTLKCHLECIVGTDTECAMDNGESLTIKWRNIMTAKNFSVVLEDNVVKPMKDSPKNGFMKDQEYRTAMENEYKKNASYKVKLMVKGDSNVMVMISVGSVAALILFVVLIITLRKGQLTGKKSNKKEIYADSSRIQQYDSGTDYYSEKLRKI